MSDHLNTLLSAMDVALNRMHRSTRQFYWMMDPDKCPDHLLDFHLKRLGWNAPIPLDPPDGNGIRGTEQRRRVIKNLIGIYKLRGTAPGIVDVIKFFLNLDVTFDYPGNLYASGNGATSGYWRLDTSKLGSGSRLSFDYRITDSLNSADMKHLFMFRLYAAVPSVLNEQQVKQVATVAQWAKPAEANFRIYDGDGFRRWSSFPDQDYGYQDRVAGFPPASAPTVNISGSGNLSNDESYIDWIWTAVPSALSYEINLTTALTPQGDWVDVGNVLTKRTIGVPGTQIRIFVRAKNAFGPGPYGQIPSPATYPPVPNVISKVTGSVNQDKTVKVAWENTVNTWGYYEVRVVDIFGGQVGTTNSAWIHGVSGSLNIYPTGAFSGQTLTAQARLNNGNWIADANSITYP